jgi:hypothetical protein
MISIREGEAPDHLQAGVTGEPDDFSGAFPENDELDQEDAAARRA